jgi:hypothetical protein
VSRRSRPDDPLSPLALVAALDPPGTGAGDGEISVRDRRPVQRTAAEHERPLAEGDAWAGFGRDDAWIRVDPLAELAELDRRVQAAGGVPGRRTVEITGHTGDVYVPRRSRDSEWADSHAPSRSRFESRGFQPDRAAMWAIFLGLLLILVAAASAHAAVLTLH